MQTKSRVSRLLRKLGLLQAADRVFYYKERMANAEANKAFKAANPDVKLPPDYLMFESFQLNYLKYYEESKQSAKWVPDHFANSTPLSGKKVLDWGCGPGRVIRHLPNYFDKNCHFFGTDYNKASIAWCSKNLPGIQFSLNGIEAKLAYDTNYFDCLYGISIFTHLSEANHTAWFAELLRVLKPGGIMMLTTQGDHFKQKLTPEELTIYDAGNLVVRGQVKEGHRTYSAFHPTAYMERLFKDVEILEHEVRTPLEGRALPQDVWMLRKK